MGDLHDHCIKESVGHLGRATTIVQIADLDVDGEDSRLSLVDTIARLQKILEDIPEEFRATARLNIRAYGDYASASSSITFERPETDEELAARRSWLKSLDDESERRDRREFQRLKQKFEARSA